MDAKGKIDKPTTVILVVVAIAILAFVVVGPLQGALIRSESALVDRASTGPTPVAEGGGGTSTTTTLPPVDPTITELNPNPFDDSVAVGYALFAPATDVSVKAYNTLGQLVATLEENDSKPAGNYTVWVGTSNWANGNYIFELTASGESDSMTGTCMHETTTTTTVPMDYSLSQNYPNPFSSSTSLDYQVPTQSHVIITAKGYNILGQLVHSSTLVDNSATPAGTHTVAEDTSSWSSGTYKFKMEVPGVYSQEVTGNKY